jgi:hypothetical protein
MTEMTEPASANSETHTISEAEFVQLCDEIYADRQQIYQFNPNASRREALLWMLAGCLINLLSIPILEQPSVYARASTDPYLDAVSEILQSRAQPPFDPYTHLAELSKKIDDEF